MQRGCGHRRRRGARRLSVCRVCRCYLATPVSIVTASRPLIPVDAQVESVLNKIRSRTGAPPRRLVTLQPSADCPSEQTQQRARRSLHFPLQRASYLQINPPRTCAPPIFVYSTVPRPRSRGEASASGDCDGSHVPPGLRSPSPGQVGRSGRFKSEKVSDMRDHVLALLAILGTAYKMMLVSETARRCLSRGRTALAGMLSFQSSPSRPGPGRPRVPAPPRPLTRARLPTRRPHPVSPRRPGAQATLLLVFTPQQCGDDVCTQRQNIQVAWAVARPVLFVNFGTLLVYVVGELVIFLREVGRRPSWPRCGGAGSLGAERSDARVSFAPRRGLSSTPSRRTTRRASCPFSPRALVLYDGTRRLPTLLLTAVPIVPSPPQLPDDNIEEEIEQCAPPLCMSRSPPPHPQRHCLRAAPTRQQHLRSPRPCAGIPG